MTIWYDHMVLALIWIEYGKEPDQQIVKVLLSIGISAAKTDPDSPLVIDRLWDLKNMTIHIRTSSTAQGGCGSFKNRKPIGEIGCCESGMAERSH